MATTAIVRAAPAPASDEDDAVVRTPHAGATAAGAGLAEVRARCTALANAHGQHVAGRDRYNGVNRVPAGAAGVRGAVGVTEPAPACTPSLDLEFVNTVGHGERVLTVCGERLELFVRCCMDKGAGGKR